MANRNFQSYIIKIYCMKCSALLYEYKKEGKGHLVKCYKDGIIKDNIKDRYYVFNSYKNELSDIFFKYN